MRRKKGELGDLPDEIIPQPQEKNILETISIGQRFMQKHIPRKTSAFSLVLEQAKYISPSLWGTQFLALLLLIACIAWIEPSKEGAQLILFRIAPLLALLAVPEWIKDIFHRMSELENSCKNNSVSVLLSRLIAIGTINLSVVTLLAIIASVNWQLNFFGLMMSTLVAFNSVNILNLLAIQFLKIRNRTVGAALSMLFISCVIFFPVEIGWLQMITEPVWMVLSLVSFCILALQVTIMIRFNLRWKERVQWN